MYRLLPGESYGTRMEDPLDAHAPLVRTRGVEDSIRCTGIIKSSLKRKYRSQKMILTSLRRVLGLLRWMPKRIVLAVAIVLGLLLASREHRLW